MTVKLSEVINPAAIAATWVSVGQYRQITGIGQSTDITSPENEVTVQLRKATDGSGSDAADLGDPVTGSLKAVVTALSEDLGRTAGGVQFTHVQVVVTDTDSPNAVQGSLILSHDRFNPQS